MVTCFRSLYGNFLTISLSLSFSFLFLIIKGFEVIFVKEVENEYLLTIY